MKKKILFVGAFPDSNSTIYGGMVTACKALVNSDLKNDIDFVLLDSTQRSNPEPNIFIRSLFAFRRLIKFLYLFHKEKVNACFFFVADGGSMVEKGTMAWYCKIMDKKSYLFPRAGSVINQYYKSNSSKYLIRLFFRGGSKLICQGKVWQNFAIKELGFSIEDLPIINNWTAKTNLLKIGKQRNRVFDENETLIKIIFVGWLEEKKGIYELLEALSVLKSNYSFELTLVGDSKESPQIKNIVKLYKMEHQVHFKGWQTPENISYLLMQSHIFVLPSYSEGLPNSMIEAMSVKLVVVVADVGNIPDYITNEVNGFLVTPKDTRTLINSLEKIFNNRDLAEQVAYNGYNTAIEKFSIDVAITKMKALLKSDI